MTPSRNPPSSFSQDSPPSSVDSNFDVQSIHSSMFSDPEEQQDFERPMMSAPVVPNEGNQSVILRDALRMAMATSSESISKKNTPQSLQGVQSRSAQTMPLSYHAANNRPAIALPSRTGSPSAGSATPLSLSLSPPASPVSLSSVPASVDLDTDTDIDMDTDMDTSTTWSLYGSSEEDSRAGSPAGRPRRVSGGPSSGASAGVAAAGGRLQSQLGPTEADPSRIGRVPYPYAISRRNTATIPSLIRRTSNNPSSLNNTATQAQLQSLPVSTQVDSTVTAGNDTHSRSHWAVQESLDRQRYQGDLFDLVIPVLELPVASVSTSMVNNNRRSPSGTDDVTAPRRDSTNRVAPTIALDATKSKEQGAQSGSVLSMVLCGTNRTTNTFLRDLMRDSRFEVYKFPSPPTRLAASTQGQDVKGAYYTVGVYVVATPTDSVIRSAAEGKKLVARIKVFGKGQNSNLDNAISHIKYTYTRLDSLLRPPMKEEEDPESLGSSDMYGLVESWVWGPATSGGRNEDMKEADWCELAVLSGDGRHLLGKERSQMEELISMVPTICYPEDLSSLLSLACGLEFYTCQSSDTHPSRRHRIESDIGQVSDLLLAIAKEDSEASGTRRHLRKSGIRSFLQWRSLNLQRSYRESTILGTSRLATSTNLRSPSQSKDLAQSHDKLTAEPSPIEKRPMPTLARARGSYEGQPGNWEAGLSRRVAARRDADKDRLAASKGKKSTADASAQGISSTEKSSTQERSGFFDDVCVGAGNAPGARSTGLGVIKGLRAGWDVAKAFVYPLSLIQSVVWPEPAGRAKGIAGWGFFKVACVGLVVGLAGWWLSNAVSGM